MTEELLELDKKLKESLQAVSVLRLPVHRLLPGLLPQPVLP